MPAIVLGKAGVALSASAAIVAAVVFDFKELKAFTSNESDVNL